MGQIEEMRARVDALKKKTHVSAERTELAELAREELKERDRLDRELAELLQQDADIALALVRAMLDTAEAPPPTDAFWSLEAHKLAGVGWLVLGPEDKGYAAEALKAAGKLDGSGKFKIQETHPDICCATVVRACLWSPFGDNKDKANREKLNRALTDAPEFVVAAYQRVKALGGSVLNDAAGKSTS
jgi:hypothetical protein